MVGAGWRNLRLDYSAFVFALPCLQPALSKWVTPYKSLKKSPTLLSKSPAGSHKILLRLGEMKTGRLKMVFQFCSISFSLKDHCRDVNHHLPHSASFLEGFFTDSSTATFAAFVSWCQIWCSSLGHSDIKRFSSS